MLAKNAIKKIDRNFMAHGFKELKYYVVLVEEKCLNLSGSCGRTPCWEMLFATIN